MDSESIIKIWQVDNFTLPWLERSSNLLSVVINANYALNKNYYLKLKKEDFEVEKILGLYYKSNKCNKELIKTYLCWLPGLQYLGSGNISINSLTQDRHYKIMKNLESGFDRFEEFKKIYIENQKLKNKVGLIKSKYKAVLLKL